MPLFLYPDVQWAFPRLRDIVDDVADFRPDVVHVATEFALGLTGLKAARQLRLPVIASAHTDYEQYAASVRRGLGGAGRLALPPLVLWPGRTGCSAPRASIRSTCTVEVSPTPASGAGGWIPAVSIPAFAAKRTAGPWASQPGDLLVTYIGRIAREKNLGLLLEAWDLLGS